MSNKPVNIAEYRQQIVTGRVRVDRVQTIERIIDELDQGQFRDAALLFDMMRRDDRIRGSFGIRTNALLGAPLEIEPAKIRGKVTARTQRIADAALVEWPRLAPKPQMATLAEWGWGLGLGIGEWIWDQTDDTTRGRLKVWHPSFCDWDHARRCFRLYTEGEEQQDGSAKIKDSSYVYLPRTDRQVHSDGKWLLYTPYGYDHCWRYGLVRALAKLYVARQWNFLSDWPRKNEIFGQGIRKAVSPTGAALAGPDGQAASDKFVRSVNGAGSGMVVQCFVDAEKGHKLYDLELLESSQPGSETFGELQKRLDESIGNLILGQNAAGGKVSGLGDGQTNADEAIRHAFLKADAESMRQLEDQGLYWWVRYNYGDDAEQVTPHLCYKVDPEEDSEARARKYQTLFGAVAAAEQLRAGVDTAEILADEGVPLLEFDRDEMDAESSGAGAGATPSLDITPTDVGLVVRVNEVRASRGLGPLLRPDGSRDPDGDLTIAQYRAKNADVVAEGEAAKQGEIIDAGAADGEQRLALVADTSAAPPPRYRPRHYPDRLAMRAAQRARAAIAPDVEQVLAAVREAKDPEDLRRRLVELAREFDPKGMARIVERATLIAELAGREEIVKDL